MIALDLMVFSCMVLCLSFYMIRGVMDMKFRFMLGAILCFALAFFLILFWFAAQVSSKGQGLKGYQHEIGKSQPSSSSYYEEAPYIKACYKGCGDISIHIHPFCKLTRHTPITILMIILDNLVSLLCAAT